MVEIGEKHTRRSNNVHGMSGETKAVCVLILLLLFETV